MARKAAASRAPRRGRSTGASPSVSESTEPVTRPRAPLALPANDADPDPEIEGTAGPVSEDAVSAMMARMAGALGGAFERAMDRQARKTERSNPDPPRISEFRPLGENTDAGYEAYKDLQFHRQPFFNNGKVAIDQLTPPEIEAYNAVSRLLKGPGDKLAARGGKWTARVSENNDQLHIIVPCKMEEDRTEVNSLYSIELLLRELATGQPSGNPLDMMKRIEELEAKLNAIGQPSA